MKISKNNESSRYHLLTLCAIGFLAIIFVNMTDGAKKSSSANDPTYAPLQEGEQSVAATIYDESTITEIYDASFFGHVTIGGIRKETDDSNNTLDLTKIKELNIIQSTFSSKRFSDRDFSLIRIITTDGTLIDNLLIPKKVILCGLERKTNMERAWFLDKIDKFVIETESPSKKEIPEVAIDKAFKAEQEKWENAQEKQEPVATEQSKKTETPTQEHGFMHALGQFISSFFHLLKALVKSIINLF